MDRETSEEVRELLFTAVKGTYPILPWGLSDAARALARRILDVRVQVVGNGNAKGGPYTYTVTIMVPAIGYNILHVGKRDSIEQLIRRRVTNCPSITWNGSDPDTVFGLVLAQTGDVYSPIPSAQQTRSPAPPLDQTVTACVLPLFEAGGGASFDGMDGGVLVDSVAAVVDEINNHVGHETTAGCVELPLHPDCIMWHQLRPRFGIAKRDHVKWYDGRILGSKVMDGYDTDESNPLRWDEALGDGGLGGPEVYPVGTISVDDGHNVRVRADTGMLTINAAPAAGMGIWCDPPWDNEEGYMVADICGLRSINGLSGNVTISGGGHVTVSNSMSVSSMQVDETLYDHSTITGEYSVSDLTIDIEVPVPDDIAEEQ